MRTKVKVFGQIAGQGFETKAEQEEALAEFDRNSLIYTGHFSAMPKSKLLKITPLSPDFMEYYANMMAILWGGALRKHDSENPHMALESHFPVWAKYVIFWTPITD